MFLPIVINVKMAIKKSKTTKSLEKNNLTKVKI